MLLLVSVARMGHDIQQRQEFH